MGLWSVRQAQTKPLVMEVLMDNNTPDGAAVALGERLGSFGEDARRNGQKTRMGQGVKDLKYAPRFLVWKTDGE